MRRVLDQQQTARDCAAMKEEEDSRFSCDDLVAGDLHMVQALDLARKVAPTLATVLITGESGTGKEVFARCIHRNSGPAHSASSWR